MRACLGAASIVFLLALTCCRCGPTSALPDGDDFGDGGAGDGNGGTTVDRSATLESIRERFESLADGDPETTNQEMADYMAGLDGIEAAGVSLDSCSWARFTDGVVLIVVNNTVPAQASDFEGLAAASTRLWGTPKSTRIRALNGLGTLFFNPTATLESVFAAHGYTVASGREGSIDALKQVSGDGVFYFCTHGGTGKTRTGDLFGLWTTVPYSVEQDLSLMDDLTSSRLCLMLGTNDQNPDGSPTYAIHYAITEHFVREYMDFGENSFVCLDACSGIRMQDVCFERHASLFAGWTRPAKQVSILSASFYLIDRMLGANVFDAESPPQRPFDYSSVVADMIAQNLGYESKTPPSSSSYQVVTPNPASDGGDCALLKPSIRQMEVDEADYQDETESTLFLYGYFGEEKGTVTVNGTEVAVKEDGWSSGIIECALPATGAGSAGDVVVEAHGLRSNPRRLTQWSGVVLFSCTVCETLAATGQIQLCFRGDVMETRSEAGSPSQPPTNLHFSASPATTGEFTAEGEYERETYDPELYRQRWQWSPNQPLELRAGDARNGDDGPSREIHFEAAYDGPSRTLTIWSLEVFAEDGIHEVLDLWNVTLGNMTHSQKESDQSLSYYSDTAAGGDIVLALDDSFAIPAGQFTHTESSNEAPSGERRYTLEWAKITPTYPPDDTYARALSRLGPPT